ncbi:hypothetical protein [Spongiactinospora gelatinilytica]|uniref:hypothetical protein n=1 Tax=Spongiactinospora gelatinilytica TaxID=2666298 RepID=UPI00131444F3|nr:hypothetical protein [Spongiactinospora gelatinilytica]
MSYRADRIYTNLAEEAVVDCRVLDTEQARHDSDHLPVVGVFDLDTAWALSR